MARSERASWRSGLKANETTFRSIEARGTSENVDPDKTLK